MTTPTLTIDPQFELRRKDGQPLDLTADQALAVATLLQIEAHPELHNQGSWMRASLSANTGYCGTAGCFAGWAVALAGRELAWETECGFILAVQLAWQVGVLGTERPARECRGFDWEISYRGHPDGVARLSVAAAARQLLGLSDHAADNLFAANNTREDLRELVEDLFVLRADEYELAPTQDPAAALRSSAEQAFAAVNATTESPEEGK